MEDFNIKPILPRLMADQGSFEIRSLTIQPEAVQLILQHLQVLHRHCRGDGLARRRRI